MEYYQNTCSGLIQISLGSGLDRLRVECEEHLNMK